jgi:hypothetical protein
MFRNMISAHFMVPGIIVKRTNLTRSQKEILYTECTRRNVPDFGRVFRMLKYIDITENTYVQS